jgi:regulator of sigma E protease
VIASRVIGAVHPIQGATSLSELRAGDTITAVNGVTVASWNDVAERISGTTAGEVAIRTQRNEVRIPLSGPNAPTAGDVASSIDFFIPPKIGEVLPGSPAARAGLQADDSIVTIGHASLRSWAELQERVSASAGKDIAFEVLRGGTLVPLTLRPEPTSVRDPLTKQMKTVGKIGAVGADITVRAPMGVSQSLRVAGRQTWLTGGKIIGVVRGLLTREVSVRQLGGPIAITKASVAAAQSGLESLFMLIALLSVNVAVLNLLPIPILDGGQILLNVAEAAKGSPFSSRTREYILRFGLLAILLIFALSTFNDVKPWIVSLFS